MCVPSLILDTDQIADSISNFSETFIYTIYAVVILLSIINRRKQTVVVTKSKGQISISIIAIIGCFLAAGYCVFYSYSFQLIEPNDATNPSHSGLFLFHGS
ncbi:hypothetical protein FACS1894218_4210 [Bacilli bacterium]|nr:hypothetical protein FACS1894218_4210 [Bacilli bacterium]